MKKGDVVQISLAQWRGTPHVDGRTTGMMLRVHADSEMRLLLEFEFSIDQLGQLISGGAANATVHFVPKKK